MAPKLITLDATGRSLGRVASEAAAYLRGKYETTFDPGKNPNVSVTITNARAVRITGKKLAQKNYYRFSGYPGGLKSTSLKERLAQSPDWVIRTAVRSMLPATKLRSRLLRHLTITE